MRHTVLLVSGNSKGQQETQKFGGPREICQNKYLKGFSVSASARENIQEDSQFDQVVIEFRGANY